LEDVEHNVNTVEAVAPWCSIDLSSGNLTVVLEPFNCFDAEVYADELDLPGAIEFREDQRSKYSGDDRQDIANLFQSVSENGFFGISLPI
jgi:hypothetical protein